MFIFLISNVLLTDSRVTVSVIILIFWFQWLWPMFTFFPLFSLFQFLFHLSYYSKSYLFYCFNNSYSLSSNGLRMHECVCLCIHWHSTEWTDIANMYTYVVHTFSLSHTHTHKHTHHLRTANRQGKKEVDTAQWTPKALTVTTF